MPNAKRNFFAKNKNLKIKKWSRTSTLPFQKTMEVIKATSRTL